jgi:hypothetical protein
MNQSGNKTHSEGNILKQLFVLVLYLVTMAAQAQQYEKQNCSTVAEIESLRQRALEQLEKLQTIQLKHLELLKEKNIALKNYHECMKGDSFLINVLGLKDASCEDLRLEHNQINQEVSSRAQMATTQASLLDAYTFTYKLKAAHQCPQ